MLNRPRFSSHLTLSTISFALCFAMWGLVGAFGPVFREMFHLSGTQAAFLVAVPVLLGSLARLPMGILTDRFGGRIVFTGLMVFVSLSALIVPQISTYPGLIVAAFFMGVAGSSFAVGVGYVSGWARPDNQGTALGIYGLGTMGQSAAVFLGPVLASALGWQSVFYIGSAVLLLWAATFGLFARDAPTRKAPPISVMIGLLRERLAWGLGAFYFLTFGGFVAFSIYLPLLLRDQFKLTFEDAGFRTAGFVVLATLLRPVGGWLADRIGGSRVLAGVFVGLIPFALLMSWPAIVPFTVGALGCAALLGLGNGGVFKLVPEYFPSNTGVVTGLVGAMGGLGGFFPPLLLGFFRERFGLIWPAFVLLAATSAALWRLNAEAFLPRQIASEQESHRERYRVSLPIRAGVWATFATGLLIASIVVGSRNLANFDAALVIYTFATIFTTWGVSYHYYMWLQKPPTRLYWQRTWGLLRKQGMRGVRLVIQRTATDLGFQAFIRKRSLNRWLMHQCLFWGCLLAVAITFPLVFGWIYFGSAPNDQMRYVTYLFGFPVASFKIRTIVSWFLFHGLDVAAVIVLTGVGLSLWRRMRDHGAQAVQSFSMDFFPLILLTAISVTGLALTASTTWLRGNFYDFLSILHAVTVVTGLLYLPFGKFFHIFQRPAQIGVKLYKEEGKTDSGAHCARCGERFASRMHVDDLKQVLRELGFDYSIAGPAETWQDICPACKRKSLANAQLRIKEEAHGRSTD
jgi:MFS transporter, NNP family, nitrate/nitrite transporter